MNTDCYTNIGRQHTICQDYARTATYYVPGRDDGLYDGIPPLYAAVSDGCSMAEDSDVGARLLTLGLRNALLARFAPDEGEQVPEDPATTALEWAWDIVKHGRLEFACLDATLLYAYPDGDEIHVVAHGDGVVAARRRDGTIEYTVIECPLNAPDYLSYLMDPARRKVYESKLREININGEGLKTYRSFIGTEMTSVSMVPPFYPMSLGFPREDYDLIVLMSDGAQSFMRETPTGTERVPVHEVVQQVMEMKNTSGEFVVRRVRNGFLNRFCPANRWHHYDDFAVAAIHLGDEP